MEDDRPLGAPAETAPALPEGPLAMLVTPFTERGEPDVDGLCRQAAHAAQLGAAGLALFGLAGEGFKLTDSEQESLLGAVAAANDGRLPIITAVDRGGSWAATAHAERAVELGTTAIMAMPPSGPGSAADDIVRHFDELARVGVPLVVQDAPAASGVRLDAQLIDRMVRTVGGIAGIKVEAAPTAPKVDTLRRRLSREIVLYGGRGGLSHIAELVVGARGTMVGPGYIDEFAAIWDDFRAGNLASARRRFHAVLPAIAFADGNDLYAQTQKDLLHRAGIIESAAMRHPTRAMPAMMREEWRRLAAGLRSRRRRR